MYLRISNVKILQVVMIRFNIYLEAPRSSLNSIFGGCRQVVYLKKNTECFVYWILIYNFAILKIVTKRCNMLNDKVLWLNSAQCFTESLSNASLGPKY